MINTGDMKEIRVKEFTIEDLFLIAELINKVDIKIEYEEGKPQAAYGLDMFKACLKGSKKVQKDVYQLISNITEIPFVEVKKIGLKQLRMIIEKVLEVNDMEEVFTQVKDAI